MLLPLSCADSLARYVQQAVRRASGCISPLNDPQQPAHGLDLEASFLLVPGPVLDAKCILHSTLQCHTFGSMPAPA